MKKLQTLRILPNFTNNTSSDDYCSGCRLGKMTRAHIPKVAQHSRGRATASVERIRLNTIGPITPLSIGNKYMLLLTDQHSYYRWLLKAKKKLMFSQLLINLLTKIQRRYDLTIKYLRLDNGTEINISTFNSYIHRASHSNSHTNLLPSRMD